MAKLVILKSLLDSYYDNMIEKSTTHKYIRRVPKSSGKGYNYFYPSDFKKPIKALLSFFGMKEETINNAYKNNNIQEAYGVTKQGFAQHVLEYLTNRKTWNTFFANKENRERYKIPEKPVKATETVKVTEKEIVGGKTTEKITVEEKETQEKNFKSTWNRSLMRKVYSMYNTIPEDKAENKPGIDSIKVGDTVSYNGRTGKVTKDFENGMVFISFENGGMGRFAVKDLQKMNPTAEEVTETATENADEQNVNGTNEAVKETLEDYYAGGVVESTREKLATEKQYTPYEVEFYMNRSVDEIKADLEREKSRKEPNTRLIAALEGALSWHQIPDESAQEENEKPGFSKTERTVITVLYNKIKKDNPDLRDYQIYEKIKASYPELDAHGDILKTMKMVKNLMPDASELPKAAEYIVTKEVKENPYNSVGADIVKDYTEKLDKVRNTDELTDKQKMAVIRDTYISEFVKISVDVANKTSDTKEQATEKARQILDAIKNNMPENEQALFRSDYNFDRLVDLKWDKKKPSMEKLRVNVANEFVEGKKNYLNAIPLASNNARIMFNKIWDGLKDKSRNEQIRGLYNAVKDDYAMSWTDSQNYRKQGYSDEEIRFGYINDFLNAHSDAEEHENRSQAMLGNQNARKYGNLSEEANEVIARQNLNVNDEGVVQPSEEEVQASADFWKKNENKNYKLQKDQYGNTYMVMDGLEDYFYDKDGNRVGNATMVHERTYHDEYIPQEPHIILRHNGGMHEYIYLTPDMKAAMNSENRDYQPVNAAYVKPERDTIREEYIDIQDEKTQDKLNNRTYQMNKLYDMAKKTGIQVMEYTGGMMSNHGKITHVVLPLGETNQNSENAIFIDKTDKALVDYAKYLSNTVEPETRPERKNANLTEAEKNILALAYQYEKRFDPTMSNLWYIDKVKEKMPELANKVDNWGEIQDKDITTLSEGDIAEIREHAKQVDNEEHKNSSLDYYVSGDGMWINKYLRNPEQFEKENGKLSDDDKKIIEELRNQTNSETITEKKLYRSVDAKAVFGDISDLDFDNLVATIVYDNKDKPVVDKAQKLISGALNKEITEKGFMSTTKDKEIAENWDGFTGSNRDVVLELNIPDGMKGKDMAAYEVEDDEQKEVLLPDNVDYKVTEITKGENGKILIKADVLGVHGNHIAMLGNQNARKDGLTQEEADSLEYYVQDAGYTYINDKLRGVDETPMEQHHKDAVKNIDNVISRNTVKEKTLYRGMGGNVIFPEMNPYEHRLMELYLSDKAAYDSMPNDYWWDAVEYKGAKDNVERYIKEIEGRTFNDKGFVSTSKTFEATEPFTESHKNDVVIEFQNIPENTHGVDLSDFKEGREFRDENEVLLHRDLNYKITGTKSINGKIVLTAEIIPESEAEKHQNRSEAMMGNDNAAGERAKKPQTEKAMKKEEKKLEKARVDAGLPKPGMFERTSTIDDTTWDPNSKDYRFRDTGYIAGARKELAALFITKSAKEGVRVNAKEIDWTGIEENPRQAEKLIVKSNIFGEVDWNGLREKGMNGSAAFLIDRIYASAGAKPSENNADARHNYVIALNGLRDRFEDCKTVDDVMNTLDEIRDEIRGEFLPVKQSEHYQKEYAKIKELFDKVRAKKQELNEARTNAVNQARVAQHKVLEKIWEEAKAKKLVRWNARISEYNLPEDLHEKYIKESNGVYSKVFEEYDKPVADFKKQLIDSGVPESAFTRKNTYNNGTHEILYTEYVELMPEYDEAIRLDEELKKWTKAENEKLKAQNPLLEAWKSLGSRFLDIKQSDSFAQHRYAAKKGEYDNWEWLEKDVKVKEKKQSKEKKLFNLLVADSIERKGGRNIDITSTADLKKAFNLREVQSGNWVLKDPESAEFHVRNAARAFADLADLTGIPDDKISLNGRLAMAFGARGTGNAGGSSAMAHYESVERVINLTKFKGGGCLGHEWFHAFDNLITCAMSGDNTQDIFLSNRFSNLTDSTKELVLEYLQYKDATDYMGTYRRGQLARKLKAKNFDVAQLNKPKTALQLKVQNAFDNLVRAMTTGTSEIRQAVIYSKQDYDSMLYNFKEENIKQWREQDKMYRRDKPRLQVAIADAGNLSAAVKEINSRYAGTTDKRLLKQKSQWVRLAAAYYDRQPDGNKNSVPLLVDSGRLGSQFLADAYDLDKNGERSKEYWSSTHEMAARAFSSYIEDTLAEQGRKNDYLAYAADNKFYPDGNPYPEGEERKRINAAFKQLFEVIKENNAIEKAVAIVDAPDFIIKNGRFLIRK